jgi:hypothetical protein
MEADRITPWHDGGKTEAANCPPPRAVRCPCVAPAPPRPPGKRGDADYQDILTWAVRIRTLTCSTQWLTRSFRDAPPIDGCDDRFRDQRAALGGAAPG